VKLSFIISILTLDAKVEGASKTLSMSAQMDIFGTKMQNVSLRKLNFEDRFNKILTLDLLY
jgi:hypothetical protein